MKKVILFVFGLITLIFVPISSAQSDIKYMTGIKEHTFKNKPYAENQVVGETIYMIPLRETCETLGFKVNWKNNGSISVEKGMFSAKLKVDKDEYKNRHGLPIRLYITPKVIDGVTYVPHIFFSYVLNIDTFCINDTIYFRYKIENIQPKVYSKYEFDLEKIESSEKTEKVDKNKTPRKTTYVVYPYINYKEHRFVNSCILELVKSFEENYEYDELYVKYDIGVYNNDFLSIVFDGFLKKGDKTKKILDSINFDLKKRKNLTPNDILSKDFRIRDSIVKKLKDSDKVGKFGFDDVKMYLLDEALIFFVSSTDNIPMDYYKFYILSEYLLPEYKIRLK